MAGRLKTWVLIACENVKMMPNIPLPTDNLYKFTCLFGLALIVASCVFLPINYDKHLTLKIQYLEKIVELKNKYDTTEKLSEREKQELKLNEKLLEISSQNEDFSSHILFGILGTGIGLSVIGFGRWYTVTHKQEQRIRVIQLEKLELELRELKLSRRKVNYKSID